MPIIYDSSVGQYRGENGRFISRDRVLGIIDASTLAKNLSQDIKLHSIQMAAMAKGGIKRLTFSDCGKIGKAQQERNKRVRSLVDGLIAGTVSEKQALQRVAQYAGSIKQIYSVIEHSEQSRYYNQAKRSLLPGA